MAMDAKKISDYLDQIRWGYRVVDDNTILTGYGCIVPFYDFQVPIEIRTSTYWLSIRALLQRGVDRARLPVLASFLATLNANCRSARYFLVEDCAVLQAEIPLVRVQRETFVESLTTICRYSSITGLEVAMLATNPSVAELYKEVEKMS